MRVNPINSSYQDNTNFNGTVDKSVYRYLNEVRYDALNKPSSFFLDSTGKKITAESYDKVKVLIENIMSKLNSFMEKTHPKTNLFLTEMANERNIRIENKALDTCIMSGYDWPKDSIKDDSVIRYAPKFPARLDGIRCHSFSDLQALNGFVEELDKKIDPKEIDSALFEKKVAEVVKNAEETAPKNRFENRMAFSNLDKLAPKFHKEPVYMERFGIIQSLATKLKEGKANISLEQSKEDLKNLKIK